MNELLRKKLESLQQKADMPINKPVNRLLLKKLSELQNQNNQESIPVLGATQGKEYFVRIDRNAFVLYSTDNNGKQTMSTFIRRDKN